MTRLLSLVLVASAAVAQQVPVVPCGTSAGGGTKWCVGTAGQDVDLGSTLLETRGSWPDAGLAILRPVTSGATLQLEGAQGVGNITGRPNAIIRTKSAIDGGVILSVRNNNTEIFAVNASGASGTFASQTVTGTATIATGKIDVLDAGVARINGTLQTLGPNLLGQITTAQALDAGLFSKVGGVSIGGVVAQDGGVATHVCQYGYGAMTANALAVTFTRAFSSNTSCTCSHVDTTNTNPCTILAAGVPTTTGVTFAVASGGTDVVHWMCCGDL